ncbi:class I SAM-dependent methyltransferase [Sabulicella glaciei]|uniref:Class I SAM-dependent methyltransferase n=1 Tax=Sabulicella glaciei TaxID=2984948 RepID=A0ABT3NTC3_9PROT|nr:class I SAM-dependent methyltransferase [Roseococcus sp. MDT2-1-1]MCW8085405.1 class I SAM-dependent methyltransferase [Roseococcus sp. MDT2-1-1]
MLLFHPARAPEWGVPDPGPGRSVHFPGGAAKGVEPMGGRLSEPDAEGWARFHPDPAAPIHGLALMVPFLAGRGQSLSVELRPAPGSRLRIDFSGDVTRMRKAYVHLDAEGRVEQIGEELLSCETTPLPGDGWRLEARLLPIRSRMAWIGLHPENAGEQPLAWREARFETFLLDQPWGSRAEAGLVEEDGVLHACHAWSLFGDCGQLDFEIFRPGTALSGLALESPLPLSHASWITSDPPRGESPSWPEGLFPIPAPTRPPWPLQSPGLMERLGPEESWRGHRIRFLLDLPFEMERTKLGPEGFMRTLRLHAHFADGHRTVIEAKPSTKFVDNWSRLCDAHLARALEEGGEGQVFLELGARGPASIERRKELDPRWRYIASDIHDGPNVDLVADAHRLSEVLPAGSVGVCWSNSVMEHLLSPERVVLEANRLLRPGGLFVAVVPCSWPLHAEPWDFQRFTVHKWPALLNDRTGFEILDRFEMLDFATVPRLPYMPGLDRMPEAPSPGMTGVVARKTGPTQVTWEGWHPGLASGRYDP